MTKAEAKVELLMHLGQCGALMPIEWVRENSDWNSPFMQAFRIALDALEEKEE